MQRHHFTTRLVVTGIAALAAGLGATLGSAPSLAVTQAAGAEPGHRAAHAQDKFIAFYDARRGATSGVVAAQRRAAAEVAARPQARALRSSLGDQALLDIDPTTGTVRLLARLDGYLTGPSDKSPVVVARKYVGQHTAALGLTAADLATLHLRRDYRDVTGIHHLSWTQRIRGVDVFGNGLTASVTKTGRLLTVGGSPVTKASAGSRDASRLPTGAAAIRASRRDLDEPRTTPGPRDVARKVLFVTSRATHLGWQTVTMSADRPALSVLDARSGTVLFRRSLRAAADPPHGSSGQAFLYFPKAPHGGTPHTVDYTGHGWLPGNATKLSGNNSHTYSDVNDDQSAQASEEVHPSSGHAWNYLLKPFHLKNVSFCDNPYPCSWNPDKPFSWQTNRAQDAAQVFFFVNTWHDHLMAKPIGFTEAAGNFEKVNATGQGKGGDPVDTQTDDGANTDHGLPDGAHIDNANMDTPPDGQAPTMQMYLQHEPGTSYPDGDPWSPTNVGDEADTVYHEYTHGLSFRLVVDAAGNPALFGVQSGAMGEAWSDWYAMDYLVRQHLQPDVPSAVDLVLFQYDGDGALFDRFEPMDCKVGSKDSHCPGGETGHKGGFTYADYGRVFDEPEVHSDGEIWAQTLWDLRRNLGSSTSEQLVTRAMELSPAGPSFLDMRNAILMADTAGRGGADRSTIWKVFAKRGMGFYAGSFGETDGSPAADFHTPPASDATGVITGKVTDADTHKPLAGVPVTLAFQGGGTVNPTATTGSDGRYRLGPVPVGHYGKVGVVRGGYDPVTRSVDVTASGATASFAVRRNWLASSGGADVVRFNGPDYTAFGCGPVQAIDGSQVTGWGSTTGNDDGDPTGTFVPKSVVFSLPAAVDVNRFEVDPAATCGDDPTSSMGAYTIETSGNGTTWTTAATGTFHAADDGRLNKVTPTAGKSAVRFVRLTMRGNQTPSFASTCPAGADTGCSFTDMSEIKLYGAAH